MATRIVSAYLGNHTLHHDEIPAVIRDVHGVLATLARGTAKAAAAPQPAVPIQRSVTPDYLVCLEDGRKLKMLKRHLRSAYGLTPEQYRAKWGLGPDYPMVAPRYAKERSEFAKQIGLGQRALRGNGGGARA
ncbi:MAG: MucR family transcriptional regulator [Rhodovibrionaceae bacterium]